MTVSPNAVAFGNVAVGAPSMQPVILTSIGTMPVTVNSGTVTGTGFTLSGATFPLTVNPGQAVTLEVQFNPTAPGAAAGQLIIHSNSSTNNTSGINLSGTGTAPAIGTGGTGTGTGTGTGGTGTGGTGTGTGVPTLSALSCNSSSITGSGSDNCTVTLTSTAVSGGLSVSLASSNAAVVVPAMVTVPANATSVSFTATVSSVTSQQLAMLTANAAGVSKSFPLQLYVAVPTLTVSSTSLSFGNVTVGSTSTQQVTLSANGAPVTVSSETVSGAGFTVSGAAFPLTVSPGRTVTLDVQFDPTATVTVTGHLDIDSNSSTGGATVISLSGTGEAASHTVDLSWVAPSSSPVPVVSYNIYRSTGSSSAYQSLGSTPDTQTTFVDTTVVSGSTYDYIVKSVDSSGVESSPSNEATAVIP